MLISDQQTTLPLYCYYWLRRREAYPRECLSFQYQWQSHPIVPMRVSLNCLWYRCSLLLLQSVQLHKSMHCSKSKSFYQHTCIMKRSIDDVQLIAIFFQMKKFVTLIDKEFRCIDHNKCGLNVASSASSSSLLLLVPPRGVALIATAFFTKAPWDCLLLRSLVRLFEKTALPPRPPPRPPLPYVSHRVRFPLPPPL